MNGVLKRLQYFLAKLQHWVRNRLVFLYKYMNCTVDKTTRTDTGYSSYFNCITNYKIIIFWYYLLAPVSILWKQTHLDGYVLVSLKANFFYQIHTLITDLCLLLLNLKMCIAISNQGFICKCRRLYARKS